LKEYAFVEETELMVDILPSWEVSYVCEIEMSIKPREKSWKRLIRSFIGLVNALKLRLINNEKLHGENY